MRVLVTGGAGYIGSHAASLLLRQEHEVVVYDNLSTGDKMAVPSGAEFVFGDIRDGDLLARVMRDRRVDAVMHFAAKLIVPESVEKPWEYYDTNVSGGLRVIEACLKSGVSNMIFSSTAAVYGESHEPVSEEDHTAPITPYGASKRMVEQILTDVGRAHSGFRWVSLRYFNVAGAAVDGTNGQRTKNATHLVKVAAETAVGSRPQMQIFGTDYPTPDGSCVRDYIHVEDLVSAHAVALEALAEERIKNQIYNCGYGHGSSVREVVRVMKSVSGQDFLVHEAPRRAGDPAQIVADVSKIRDQLAWRPKYDSLETICQTAFQWETRRRQSS